MADQLDNHLDQHSRQTDPGVRQNSKDTKAM